MSRTNLSHTYTLFFLVCFLAKFQEPQGSRPSPTNLLPLPGHSGNNRQSKGGRMEETRRRRSPCSIYQLLWRPCKLYLPPPATTTWACTHIMTDCTGTSQHSDQVRHIMHTAHSKHIYIETNNTTHGGFHEQYLSRTECTTFMNYL